MTDLGTYQDYDGRPAVRFQRVYPHPIDRVWAAISQPEELAHWFPSSVELEPRAGGAITFSGDPHMADLPGRVLVYDPPHRLAFTWGDDEVHLELAAADADTCQLTLINVLSDKDTAARNASGWAVCLAELAKHIDGVPSDGPHSADALPFQPWYDAHVAAGLPSGAAIPGDVRRSMSELEVSAVDSGVAVVTLSRPQKKNALSTSLRNEISDALDRLAADPDVRCVVITGAGDTFSAGFDLTEFTVEDAEFQTRLWESSDRFHHTVLRFPLPTIAAVNGAALAGGFDLAVMCDLRVASSTARFAHPERTFAEVVYAPLHDLVGGGVARELVLTGRVLDATDALGLGLVNRVVEPANTLSAAVEMAADIAVVPRDTLIHTKAKIVARQAISETERTLDL